MIKNFFITATLIILAGCSLFQDKDYEKIKMPEKVSVPVYEPCPTLEPIERDFLPIEDIDEDSSDEEVVKKYAQTVEILKYDNEQYESMIRSCLEQDEEED